MLFAEPVANRLCMCFCSFFLFIVANVTTVTTLSFVGLKPRIYLQDLYIPALNSSREYNSSLLNTSIFIDLKFKRIVAYHPIHYEDLNISLFYASNRSFSVGYGIVPSFEQNTGRRTLHRKAVVEARVLPWEDALRKVSGGSTVALAVEVATTYRVEQCDDDGCIYTDTKDVMAAVDVSVDGSGRKVSKNPLVVCPRSKSSTPNFARFQLHFHFS